jgi:hypothetical protein
MYGRTATCIVQAPSYQHNLYPRPHPSLSSHLELLQGACHALHCLVKGGRAGDDLGQQGVVVAADNIACSDRTVKADARPTRGAVRLQPTTVRLHNSNSSNDSKTNMIGC